MGKIRRQKRKKHAGNESSTGQEDGELEHLEETADNPFSNVDVSLGNLTTVLNNDDSRSVASTRKRDFKIKKLNKKERRILRRKTFIERINEIGKPKRNCKALKTYITHYTLNSALSVMDGSGNRIEYEKPKARKGTSKAKMRQMNGLQDIKTLQELWSDPSYKVSTLSKLANAVKD